MDNHRNSLDEAIGRAIRCPHNFAQCGDDKIVRFFRRRFTERLPIMIVKRIHRTILAALGSSHDFDPLQSMENGRIDVRLTPGNLLNTQLQRRLGDGTADGCRDILHFSVHPEPFSSRAQKKDIFLTQCI